MKIYLERKGIKIPGSPITISPEATLRDLKDIIAKDVGEGRENIELTRKYRQFERFPNDEDLKLGVSPEGLKDEETLEVELPEAGTKEITFWNATNEKLECQLISGAKDLEEEMDMEVDGDMLLKRKRKKYDKEEEVVSYNLNPHKKTKIPITSDSPLNRDAFNVKIIGQYQSTSTVHPGDSKIISQKRLEYALEDNKRRICEWGVTVWRHEDPEKENKDPHLGMGNECSICEWKRECDPRKVFDSAKTKPEELVKKLALSDHLISKQNISSSETIEVNKGDYKIMLGSNAKLELPRESRFKGKSVKFEAEYSSPSIKSSMITEMKKENLFPCGPIINLYNLRSGEGNKPIDDPEFEANLSLRHYLHLSTYGPQAACIPKNEEILYFVSFDEKSKKIKKHKVLEHNEHHATVKLEKHLCHCTIATSHLPGELCQHKFHLKVHFMKPKNSSSCPHDACALFLVATGNTRAKTEGEDNDVDWDNLSQIKRTFQEETEDREDFAEPLKITVPGCCDCHEFNILLGSPDTNGYKFDSPLDGKEFSMTSFCSNSQDGILRIDLGQRMPIRGCMEASKNEFSPKLKFQHIYKDIVEHKLAAKNTGFPKTLFYDSIGLPVRILPKHVNSCKTGRATKMDLGIAELRDPQEGRTMSPTTINNFNIGGTFNQTNNTMNILASLNPHFSQLIGTGQKQFLENVFKEQGLTTLAGFPGTETSLIKFETILKSVCMIEGGSSATGFIAKIPNHGVAFMTAGHCFKDKTLLPHNELQTSIDFNDYLLHFGNSSGSPTLTETCKLADLGPFQGSIGYRGKRRNFPGNTSGNANQYEDYCVLLFDDTKLTKFNLSYLECGEGDYLKHRQDGVVSIFGHPGEGCMEGQKRPLRVSYGKEKMADSKGSAKETSGNFLLYDNDTLPGNSGSPVIGRGDSNGKYAIKGIHVTGIAAGQTNGAQSLINLSSWIPPK